MSEENKDEVIRDNEDELEIITLTDEDGNDVDFLLLDALTVDGKDYVVLTEAEEEGEEVSDEDDVEVLIMRVGYDEDGSQFFEGADDDEADKVFDVFQSSQEDYEFGDAD